MSESTHASAMFLAAFLTVMGHAAFADTSGTTRAASKNCPADFDIVDLGRWTAGEEGQEVLDYGGILYKVIPPDKPWQDTIYCVDPDDLGGRVQVLDGKPIPLVRLFRDRDLGIRYIQRPYGDYVGDVIPGFIRMTSFRKRSVARIEEHYRRDFLLWLETADERGTAVAKGANYTCLFDPENPSLSGYGSYACMVTIDGAPFPDSFFRCGRWVDGCSARFSVSGDIYIELDGPFLPHWEEGARVNSIPQAIDFWSTLIRASIENFEASVVSRGREEILETGD